MKYSTTQIKNFINSFNIADPNWNLIPPDFPGLSKEGLTKEEGHILDAIKLAWIISGGGRTYYYKNLAKKAFLTAAIIFIIFAGNRIASIDQTNTASAKTVTQRVGEIVESTRSAILRK